MGGNAPADIRALHLKKMLDALSPDFMSVRKREREDRKDETENREDGA